MKTDSLGFSVTVFTILAALTVSILMLRRTLGVFGKVELGGAIGPKIFTAIIVGSFWIIYVLLSALVAEKVIDVGF